MRKTFTILFLVFTLITINSQRYLGLGADTIIKGCNLVYIDETNKTIKHIRFSTAANRLKSQKDCKLFLKNALNIPVTFDINELSTTKDRMGINTKYQFTKNGIPIDGYIYTIQRNGDNITSANGHYKLLKNKQPLNPIDITEKVALQFALQFIHAERYQWETDENYAIPKGDLCYVEVSNELVLTYKFDIYSSKPLMRQFIYINAQNGKVEKTIDRIHIYTNNLGAADTKYQGTKTIATDYSGGTYRLRENLRGKGVETYDMNNGTDYVSAIDFTDLDNYWNTTVNQDNAAYDAHYGSEATYDYFSNSFGRNSIDGLGFALKSYVHFDANFANAYWNGSCMTYGDGDGTFYSALTSLDVVAHEITHGLTEHTANLDYSYESGALNESFSDIFGTAIDFFANPTTANFTMGESASISGNPFRSMIEPKLHGQPDTYLGMNWHTNQDDNGGVHYNSGIQNYWFYLLCVGKSGTNDLGNTYSINPIGMEKAAAIAYRTLTVYLTPTSQYADARYYSIQSALDLYGECSNEVINVTNAWYAVGVGAQYSNGVVANFSISQNYFCSNPATVNFTNKSTNSSIFLWNFGDGTTSNIAAPSHTYTSTGNYTVSLIATGVSACSTSDTLISASPIIVANTGGPTTPSCAPVSLNSTGQNGIINFTFNEINNSTAGVSDGYKDYSCAFVTTLKEGITYTGSVSIGSYNASTIKIWLDLNNDGIFNNSTELLHAAIQTSATSTFTVNIPHTTLYNTPLRLRVATDLNIGTNLNDACTPSQYGQYEDYSVIILPNNSPPAANFTASNTKVSVAQSVVYTDLSENLPTSFEWTFDGGTPSTSTLKNPVIEYNSVGSYSVKLKAINSYGQDSITKSSYINVVDSYNMCSTSSSTSLNGILLDSGGPLGDYQNQEDCSFLINPSCAKSITLSFNTFKLEESYDYLKVYDGSNSNGILLLKATGSTLPETVTAKSGTMYITFSSDIIVAAEGFNASWTTISTPHDTPISDFAISDQNPPLQGDVKFTDLTTNEPNEWVWDFGDGVTSSIKNPIHAYNTPGSYNVTLKTAHCFGIGTTKTKTIIVQDAPSICLTPNAFNDLVLSCNDSIFRTLVIKNTGLGSLKWNSAEFTTNISDNFDSNTNNALWQSISGGITANTCGSFSAPNALYFNGGNLREAITNPIKTISGGKVNFHLKIANGSVPCEMADPGEDIVLSYSVNGGATWITIRTLYVGSYTDFTAISETIPDGAKSAATTFKWSQPSNSGSDYDNWSIDNISISAASNEFYSLSPNSGTCAPGDSSIVEILFNSTGLIPGVHNDSIDINFNNPLNSPKAIPCVLTVNGSPKMLLSDTSFAFGNIFKGATKTDTLMVLNSGCSLLTISSITSSLNEFVLNKTSLSVSPGDTGRILITFAPKSLGIFNANIDIVSNNVNATIQLTGNSIAPPIIGVSPNPLNATITTCNGSITMPLTISNTGGNPLEYKIVETLNRTDNFDLGADYSLWQSISGGKAANTCGYASAPNALYFDDGNLREAVTKPINTLSGGNLSFYLKISEGMTPCEMADYGEDVILSYSINGGVSWSTIETLYIGNYSNFTSITLPIPEGAKTAATTFKWSQPINSGTGYDNWSIDNVSISSGSATFYTLSNNSDTIAADGSVVIDVTFNAKGLIAGIHNDTIIINSNAPATSQFKLPINLLVKTTTPEVSVISGKTTVCKNAAELYSVINTVGLTYNWVPSNGTVTGSGSAVTVAWNATGAQTLSITPSNDCKSGASRILNIVVNPDYNISVAISICQGENYKGHSTTGKYIEYLKTVSYCDSIITTNLTVNSTPPTPWVTLTNGVLQSDAAFGNQWYVENTPIAGAIYNKYTPTKNGNYYVIVTLNSCYSQPSPLVPVKTLAIWNPIFSSDINIYPNPTSGLIEIKVGNYNASEFKITIYNNLGALIPSTTRQKDDDTVQADLSNLPSGIYMIIIKTKNENIISKIVKL